MQIANVSGTKFAEIKRPMRGLPREAWHLIKFQSGIYSSNWIRHFCISYVITMLYDIRVVGPAVLMRHLLAYIPTDPEGAAKTAVFLGCSSGPEEL